MSASNTVPTTLPTTNSDTDAKEKSPRSSLAMHLLQERERAIRVAVVGTAGRGVDGSKMTSSLFRCMIDAALGTVTHRFRLRTQQIVLVSGGAAWADHVAVKLWMEHLDIFQGLRLHLPCSFVRDARSPRAYDSGGTDWRTNPGRTMNSLHQRFSARIGSNTMADLLAAEALGAVIDSSVKGFHARNTLIAQSEYLIAFTWGDSVHIPKDGGTLDTWNKCSGTKVHVPLKSLQVLANQQAVASTAPPPHHQLSAASIPDVRKGSKRSLSPASPSGDSLRNKRRNLTSGKDFIRTTHQSWVN